MTIICDFENIQEMAREVAESANAIEKRKFTLRPWNRFAPEDTLWWLVPTTEWPAYAHGKGVLSPGSRLYPQQVFCGIHIEKGLGTVAAQVYPALQPRKLVLEPHWTWFKFLESLQNGALVRAVEEIRQETKTSVVIEVAAWYTADPTDFDPYRPPNGNDESDCRSSIDGGQVWFTVEGGQVKKLVTYCQQDVTRPIAKCQSLPELANALQHTKDLVWSWIDFSIGTMVWLQKDAQEPGQNWDANDVWDKLIRPWQQWIV